MLYQYLEARNAGVPFRTDDNLLQAAGSYDEGILPYVYTMIHDSRGGIEMLEDRQERTVYYGELQFERNAVVHSFQDMVDKAINFARTDARVIFESKKAPAVRENRQ